MDLLLFETWKAAVEGPVKDKALNDIVVREMPLVKRCVRNVAGKASEDLVQEGAIALVAAIKRWDPERGAWSPYAQKWVSKAIRRGVCNESVIRIPLEERPKLTAAQVREVLAVRARTGREPTAEEIGVAPDVLASWLEPPVQCALDGLRVDHAFGNDPSTDIKQDMLRGLHVLDPRAQRIVMALYVEEKSLREVADEENLSHVVVREIAMASVEKMKKRLTKNQDAATK